MSKTNLLPSKTFEKENVENQINFFKTLLPNPRGGFVVPAAGKT